MNIIDRGKLTLLLESESLKLLSDKLDNNFEKAVNELFNIKGRVITSGVGKSGHIARKAASTFASTGTPSFFVDPNECLHGDFGMITKNDYLVLYSKGGESREIIELVNWSCRQNIPYIAITNDESSTLAKNAKITLLTHVKEEACPLKLAPTVSTTTSLALSDALATALMEVRGFKAEDFAIFHPGGSLGRQLAKVKTIMHTDNLPIINLETSLYDALFKIIECKLGIAIITDDNNILKGIIVDGDLKRLLVKDKQIENILKTKVKDIMNNNPKVIYQDTLIGEALHLMEGKITNLVVVEDTKEGKKPIGIVHIHDILKIKAF
ncbi:KpsF/GutQ family sugar-phosphate isomerase [Brachyspira pilosicoli]|uniref:KpsF/GutQ family sugar-phosphate isomerase n=1 Tax=Brachyspira pilosicoli TaxID=52584 RepID=A0A5C8EGM8_BRAPL|nr:KpsF/GutQ family sugar-phosphate isomerase [Brachyspira pilosicoli]TXJ37197.1 KpsF/GutQ family sugar-phosphate isomerase [Brachyspira pilosicoli]